jgi:hypothetical protein
LVRVREEGEQGGGVQEQGGEIGADGGIMGAFQEHVLLILHASLGAVAAVARGAGEIGRLAAARHVDGKVVPTSKPELHVAGVFASGDKSAHVWEPLGVTTQTHP